MSYQLPSVSPGPRGLMLADYMDAARELGCSVAAVKAVAHVESLGGGFLRDGRPKILFEAHKFSELTGHMFDASHPNISSLKWDKRLYRGGVGEYSRLQQAMGLNAHAALKAASWGMFQILGLNHKLCGFASVESFVMAMFTAEREQLDAAVSFVKARKLDGYIRSGNWPEFARGYNGRSFKANKYDLKLAAAELKFKGGVA